MKQEIANQSEREGTMHNIAEGPTKELTLKKLCTFIWSTREGIKVGSTCSATVVVSGTGVETCPPNKYCEKKRLHVGGLTWFPFPHWPPCPPSHRPGVEPLWHRGDVNSDEEPKIGATDHRGYPSGGLHDQWEDDPQNYGFRVTLYNKKTHTRVHLPPKKQHESSVLTKQHHGDND